MFKKSSIILAALAISLFAAAEESLPGLAEKTETIAQALTDLAPEGWEANGPVERYIVKNMYDKINGRSELFMSYGVTGLTCVSLSDADDASRYVDIFLYDMTTAPGAFGVFSVERWPGNEAADLGREGYRTGTDLFFWKGRYYATIIGSGEEVAEDQLAIAKKLADRLSDEGETPWGFDVLPTGERLPETLQYFMVDALSLDFLEDTFTAEYDWAEESVKVFVSKQQDEEAAMKSSAAFKQYMQDYGSEVQHRDFKGYLVTSADMGGGYFDAVFRKGGYVAGVSGVPDRDTAIESAARLHGLLPE